MSEETVDSIIQEIGFDGLRVLERVWRYGYVPLYVPFSASTYIHRGLVAYESKSSRLYQYKLTDMGMMVLERGLLIEEVMGV